MYYKILADRVRYFKEDEEGVLTVDGNFRWQYKDFVACL